MVIIPFIVEFLRLKEDFVALPEGDTLASPSSLLSSFESLSCLDLGVPPISDGLGLIFLLEIFFDGELLGRRIDWSRLVRVLPRRSS